MDKRGNEKFNVYGRAGDQIAKKNSTTLDEWVNGNDHIRSVLNTFR